MKHFRRLFYPPAWPIAAKISVALVCAVLVPMIFTAYYNLQQSLNSVEAGEYHKLELLASSSASRLDQLIIDYHRVVAQISSDRHVVDFLSATTPENHKAQGPNLQQTIQNVLRSHPNLDVVLRMDKNGQCLAATDPKFIGENYSHIQGNFYGSSTLLGETSENPGMFFSQPVRSPHGKIIGLTVIKIRQADIWVIINALQLLGSQNYVFVIDQQGTIISHPDPSVVNHSLNIPELGVMLKTTQPGHATYHLPKSHISQIVGFAPLATQPWVLGVNQPKAEFTAPLHRLIWLNSSSVVIVGGITAIIALLSGLSISRPIHALTAAAQALEDDKFDAQVVELHQSLVELGHREDDIGQLVRVFSEMAEEVRLRDQRLKMQVQELRIEIDQTKRANHVAEITENEHFQHLQQTIQKIKHQDITTHETEKEYYQRLQTQVQSLKERSHNSKNQPLTDPTEHT